MTAHGGPDASGIPRWDFSTNANAAGPAPMAWRAVKAADATRYPDPRSTHLRRVLSHLHGVDVARIVIAASASEFIQRITAVVARRTPQARVYVPWPSYGDYARAAHACGLGRATTPDDAALAWCTVPDSPCGRAGDVPAVPGHTVLVIDAAYAPLRLMGAAVPVPARAWQLVSPNKALGLTGVRGAYAIAPEGAERGLVQAVEAAAPSWPLGAHGLAMLDAWAHEDTQHWVHESLELLRRWKGEQLARCESLGWQCVDSVTPFYVARLDADLDTCLPGLRSHGIKLRDARPFGLPKHVRVSVQPPAAQEALVASWQAVVGVGVR